MKRLIGLAVGLASFAFSLPAYSPSEVCALTVENMLLPWLTPHADHGDDYVEYLKDRYCRGEPMRAVNKATTNDGRTRWIVLTACPVEEHADGEFTLEGVIVDATELYEERECLLDLLRQKPPSRGVDADLVGTERVLIVDDDINIADELSMGLTDIGYETAPIYCPLEALAVVEEEPAAWD